VKSSVDHELVVGLDVTWYVDLGGIIVGFLLVVENVEQNRFNSVYNYLYVFEVHWVSVKHRSFNK
jgi:hypothetical protein